MGRTFGSYCSHGPYLWLSRENIYVPDIFPLVTSVPYTRLTFTSPDCFRSEPIHSGARLGSFWTMGGPFGVGGSGCLWVFPSLLFYPVIVCRLGLSSFVWKECLFSGLEANFLLNFWVKLHSIPAAVSRDELPKTSFICSETR